MISVPRVASVNLALLAAALLSTACEDSVTFVCAEPGTLAPCPSTPANAEPSRPAPVTGMEMRPLQPAVTSPSASETPVTPSMPAPGTGPTAQPSTPTAMLPSPEPAPATEPAFLLGTRIWDDTSTTSYFNVVSSIDSGVTVDPARALEVPGAAKLYSVPGIGWFGVGQGEAPTITRYTLGADDNLVAGESISLQSYGVRDLWDTLYVVSPTKAYYPDRAEGQLIVWNPSTMLVTGSIPLPQTLRPGYLAVYAYAPIVRGTQLLISVGWFDWDVEDSVLPETGLLVLDTTTDAVQRFDVDTRCGGVTQPIALADGDTYLVSSAIAAAAHRLGRLATEPCALRVRQAEDRIDPGYLMPLAQLTGGALAGEPAPSGQAGLLLRVFDPALVNTDAALLTWEITGSPAWRWARWDLSGQALVPLSELSPSTADVLWFRMGERVFASETAADYSQTTLLELTASGGVERRATVPGFLHGIAQVR
ncbi:MAG: hypothetical protein RL685_730 [Pseudomonadota bacterium]